MERITTNQNRNQDISRGVLQLVEKRQHTLSHLCKLMSEEGGFWINTVHLRKKDISEYMRNEMQFNDSDYKARLHRFFCLGISLGKLHDLSNINNTVGSSSI